MKIFTWLLMLSISAAALLASCSKLKETVFYVSPDGDDTANGGISAPFATIERARDAVRELRLKKGAVDRPVTVTIRGGEYRFTRALVFTPEDSGSAESPVTYTAYPGETPVISGGRSITGWRPGENGVWQADIPEVRAGTWYFRQLFVNGKRCIRARTPDGGFFTVDGEISMEDLARFRYRETDMKAAWANDGDVEVVALQAWAEIRMLVRAVDERTRMVTLSRKCRPSNREKNARYWVENVREGLDLPGEWYLDRAAGVLSYIPREGEHMETAVVVAPVCTELVRFEGDPENGLFVHDVTIKGLTFTTTDWTLPADGYADVQAAYDIPAVITANGVRRVSIERCVLMHHGNYGIAFEKGCADNRVVDCELSDMGAGGVKIGESVYPPRDDPALQTSGNLVSDTVIHDIGEVYPAACGVIIFLSGNNTIAHNHTYNTYYTALSNGWSWGYKETNCKGNILEYNLVHDIGRGMLSDMGGNYNLGVQPGSVIRHNVFHDITSYGYGGWGIYTDEGSSYILIENNIVYRTKSGGFHQHYGRENTVRNNIFAFAREGQVIRSRMEEHLSFTFEHNIVCWTEGPLLGSNWSDDQYKLDYNLYWNPNLKGAVMFKEWTFDAWKKRGQDVHSLIADPLFIDPANGDFTLQASSPALQLGFKPIDVSGVGPRK